jgi:hypothetical protein
LTEISSTPNVAAQSLAQISTSGPSSAAENLASNLSSPASVNSQKHAPITDAPSAMLEKRASLMAKATKEPISGLEPDQADVIAKMDDVKNNLQRAKKAGVDIARSNFFSKCLGASTRALTLGAAIALTVATAGVAAPLAYLAGASLLVSVADVGCAFENLRAAKEGREPLIGGNDALLNSTMIICRKIAGGDNSDNFPIADKIAKGLSIGIKVGLALGPLLCMNPLVGPNILSDVSSSATDIILFKSFGVATSSLNLARSTYTLGEKVIRQDAFGMRQQGANVPHQISQDVKDAYDAFEEAFSNLKSELDNIIQGGDEVRTASAKKDFTTLCAIINAEISALHSDTSKQLASRPNFQALEAENSTGIDIESLRELIDRPDIANEAVQQATGNKWVIALEEIASITTLGVSIAKLA